MGIPPWVIGSKHNTKPIIPLRRFPVFFTPHPSVFAHGHLDRGFHALVTDLHDRGLDQDVAAVLWGEFGRAPRVSRGDGRDHWPEAGAAVIAGGGFKTGQVIGETDRHGGVSKGRPYTPANVMANLYHHLGIDPATTIPDLNQRPMPLLDDRSIVKELVS